MTEPNMAAEIRKVALRMEGLVSERRSKQAKMIRDTAVALQPPIDELRNRIFKDLKPHMLAGAPCSMLRIIAQDHLEKPMNRILKWCATETGTHGFGRTFLKQLARCVKLPEMTADLEGKSRAEVWSEEAVDSSGNMPDLIVRTERAALLFENKVNAGESGGRQYSEYEKWFPGFASRPATRLALSARDPRERPSDEWMFISHGEMSKLFYAISNSTTVPIWGRIIAVQCAVAFDEAQIDEKSGAGLIAVANEAEDGNLTLQNWRILLDSQLLTLPLAPWEANT